MKNGLKKDLETRQRPAASRAQGLLKSGFLKRLTLFGKPAGKHKR